MSTMTLQIALRVEQIRLRYATSEEVRETIRNSIKELANELLNRWRNS